MVIRERIRFQRQQAPLAVEHLVFVAGTFGHSRHEDFPDAVCRMQAHGVPTAVPVIEIADHADARRVGRPYRKPRARNAKKRGDMSAQFPVDLSVGAFAKKVEIEFAQRCRESISILDLVNTVIRRRDPEAVATFSRWQGCGEQAAGMDTLHCRKTGTVTVDQFDALCLRLQGPDDPAIAVAMWAEHGERIVETARHERIVDSPQVLGVGCSSHKVLRSSLERKTPSQSAGWRLRGGDSAMPRARWLSG